MAEGVQLVETEAASGSDVAVADQLERMHDKLEELEFTFLNASGGVDGLPGQIVALDNRLKDLFAILMEDGGLEAGDFDGLAEQVANLSEQIRDTQLTDAEAGGSYAEALESLGAALAELIERPIGLAASDLEKVATREDVEALGAAIGPVRDALASLAEPSTCIAAEALQEVATKEDLAAIAAAIGPVRDALIELAERPSGISNEALDGIATREDLEALRGAIEPLKDALAQFAERPASDPLEALATRDDVANALDPIREAMGALESLATRDDIAALGSTLETLVSDKTEVAASATKDDVSAAVAEVKEALSELSTSAGSSEREADNDALLAALDPIREALKAVATREDLAALNPATDAADEAEEDSLLVTKDDLTAVVAEIKDALAESGQPPASLATALDPIREALAAIATRDDIVRLGEALGSAQAGEDSPSNAATKDDVAAVIAEVKGALAHRPAQSAGLAEGSLEWIARRDDVVALRAAMGRFKTTLAELAAKPNASGDALGDLATSAEVAALADTVKTALAAAAPPEAPQAETSASLQDSLATLATRDDVAAATAAIEALNGGDAGPDLQEAIASLKQSVDALAAPDADNGMTALTHELALMREENSALAARVEALTASVEALARRPDPVLDLTPQRELYARYAAALDGVAERVDAAASRFETGDLPAMRTALEQLSSASEDGAKFETILNVVRKISDRPDPVVDLRPQRELFAKYTAVLDGLTTRFEAAASRFETDDLAALRSALEQLTTGTVPEDDGRFDKILDVVRKIADRPDPVIDLTEQRASFAAFNSALGKALKRLEASTEALRADYDAVADRIASPTPDSATDAPPDALATLLDTNRKLAEAATRGSAAYPDAAMIRDLRFALAEVVAGARQAQLGQA